MTLDRIGPYQLVERLPNGGNATVWIGIEEGSTERVAVKQLRAGPGTEPWARFAREVKVVEGLKEFPGVLPILLSDVPDPGQKGDRAWYSMRLAERVDGVLGRGSLEEVVAAVADLGDTLTRLHALGHHHRDIKPANLYRLDGEWLVGDFGLVDVPDAASITAAGKKLGPANFLPYELIVSPDTAQGGPVDVYELAKTLWVLAASVPYAPLGHQAVDGGKYTLAFLTGGHPLAGQLDELIERCTRTDPDLRPSMAQMSQDFKAWMEMSERRSSGGANDPLRDIAAELAATFADDLTAGQVKTQQEDLARRRLTVLGYGVEQLANALAQGLRGGVSQLSYHPLAMTSLMRFRTDQQPDPVMSGLSGVRIRLRQDQFHPELVMAVVGELEVNGDFAIRAGMFLDWPMPDQGDSVRIFETIAPVDSTKAENAVNASVDALREAAPEWLAKLREHSG